MAENDVYQLTVCNLLAGKEVTNVFYYLEQGDSPQPPPTVAAELSRHLYSDIYVPFWQPIVSSDLRLTAIFGFRIWPTVSDPVTVVFSGDAGLVASDSVPNGSAVLFSGVSADHRRNFRRRFYIPGLPEAHSAQSSVTAPAFFDWQSFATGIRDTVLAPTGLAPAQWVSCAFSKTLALEVGETPYSRLTSITAIVAVRSQRGRNIRLS